MAQILPNLAQELELAKAENAKLLALLAAANKPKAMTMKVSEKGALSIYGLGRFPITLYLSQIERLLAHADQIKAFIAANRSLFATKD
jgi:hypothetical protein